MPDNALVREMTRRRALSSLGGAAVAGLIAATANACDRVDASTSGSGTLLWHVQAEQGDPVTGNPAPSIVAGSGMVYAAGALQGNGGCDTCAINAKTGAVVWQTNANGVAGPQPYAAGPGAMYGFQTPPAAETGVVASSAASGQTLWTHNAGALLNSSLTGWLAYADGLVFIAPGTSQTNAATEPVRALDATTGDVVWRAKLTGTTEKPVLANGVLYVSTADQLAALDATTGARLWGSADLGKEPTPAAFTSGIVCGWTAGSLSQSVFAVEGATGKRLWHVTLGHKNGYPVAATNGLFFLVAYLSADHTSCLISARHARSGKTAWSRVFDQTPAAFAAMDNVLYTGDYNDGTLQAVDATTGLTSWTYGLPAQVTGIATGTGVIYAADAKGNVYALEA
jgi:outer membrane protein assembly factor BamB